MTAFRPPHLSVSAVALYARCPAQYRRRYVDRITDPSTAAQATGTAFHKALEAIHRGQDGDMVWLSVYDATEEAIGDPLTMSKEHGLKLLREYRSLGLDRAIGEPERMFKLPFPSPKIPVPLLGFIDLAVPGEREFRDFKTTSGTYWNAAKVKLEPQVAVYGWAYQKLYRHRADRALWIIFNTQTVTVEPYEAVPSPEQFRVFEQQAELVWDGIVNARYDGCGSCSLCSPRVAKESTGPTIVWEENQP